jgi:hypothetical protein
MGVRGLSVCEHAFVPELGPNIGSEANFDHAIADGRLDAAWMAAISMPHVTLDRALRLVVLLGEERGPGAERAGRRFLVRFIREYDPSMQLIGMVTEALRATSRDGFLGDDARAELRELADRMEQKRAFDGWGSGP